MSNVDTWFPCDGHVIAVKADGSFMHIGECMSSVTVASRHNRVVSDLLMEIEGLKEQLADRKVLNELASERKSTTARFDSAEHIDRFYDDLETNMELERWRASLGLGLVQARSIEHIKVIRNHMGPALDKALALIAPVSAGGFDASDLVHEAAVARLQAELRAAKERLGGSSGVTSKKGEHESQGKA